MRTIVVATDFSTRSDRAIRRGMLLAKASNATLILVHAVDDDQPRHLVEMETAEAKKLLTSQASALREVDGIEASHRVELGEPFTCIASVAEKYASDLIVMGPHRRQLLKDVFVGTTAERTIRNTRIPIIMANAVPAAPYRHILVAIDMSEHSAAALRLAAEMGWGEMPAISVIHGFDAPEQAMRGILIVSDADARRFVAEAKTRATEELSKFLHDVKIDPVRQIVEMVNVDPASLIRRSAQDIGADLIVVGQRGRSALAKLMLGSVTESLLRNCDFDVLVSPCAPPAEDAG